MLNGLFIRAFNANNNEEQYPMVLKKRLLKLGTIPGLWMVGLVIFALLALACGSTTAQPSDQTEQPQPTNTPTSQSAATQAPATPQPSATQPPATSGPSSSMGDLSGDVAIDGSSTVFPITEAVAEEFGNLTEGNVRITVGVSGTGGGFEKFCNGETQISDASRPIETSEIQACQQAGIE
jgi:phosphate transport system substrate-binding protein